MINEYALKEAFGKIKEEIKEIKEEIKMLNEKLNNNHNNGETEEPIEISESKNDAQEEVNLTDSYY